MEQNAFARTGGEVSGANEENAQGIDQQLEMARNLQIASKFDLEKIFLWQDNTPNYFTNGQFEEAFGVLDERYRMGVELRNAASLLRYCVSLMATEHDYNTTKERLKSVIAELRPSSKSVLWLAKKLHKRGNCFASIIICELYFDIFFETSPPYEAFGILEEAVSCIRQTVTAMVEKEQSTESFVSRCILPKMTEMKEKIVDINVNPNYKCVKTAYVTHCIEVCETNNAARIKIIADTIKNMRDTLGDTRLHHQIYGTLCNNLGSTFLKTGLRNDAIKYYEEALECFDSATDFEIPLKKEKYIKDTKMALRRAQGLEEEIGIGFAKGETNMPDCPIS